jgi:hypothetical protein
MEQIVYRVSWIIEHKRREKFFYSKEAADAFVSKLNEAGELLEIRVSPLIGEVEVETL